MHNFKCSDVYPNVVILAFLMGLASIVFSVFAPEALAKAAFLVSVTAAPMYLTAALAFARRASKGNGSPMFDFNVVWLVGVALLMVGFTVYAQDVSVFADMVAEGIAVAITSTVGSIIMAFVNSE